MVSLLLQEIKKKINGEEKINHSKQGTFKLDSQSSKRRFLNLLVEKVNHFFRADIHFYEILKKSSSAFIFKLLGTAMSYLFTLGVARFFGVKALGIYALVFSLLQVFTMISIFGLDTAIVRFISEFSTLGKYNLIRKTYSTSLAFILVTSISLAILLYFCSPLLATYVLKKEYMTDYFKYTFLIILPFSIMQLNNSFFRALKKITEFAFFKDVFFRIFAIIFLIGFYFFYKNSASPLIAFSISIIISSIFTFHYVRKFIWNFNFKSFISDLFTKYEEIHFRKLIKVSNPMFLVTSILLVMNWINILFIGIYKSEYEVGIYNAALRTATILVIILTSINAIAAPKFAELYSNKDFNQLKNIACKITKYTFWSAFPIFLIILIFPGLILSLFGKEFVIGSQALQLIAIGHFVHSICGSVGYLLLMTDHQRVVKNVLMAAAVINIVLSLILIPKFGINGAAYANVISSTFWGIVLSFFVLRNFGFSIFYFPFRWHNSSTNSLKKPIFK